MKERIYIAGPMSGLPEFNFPAFNTLAAKLRKEGYIVENPAENGYEVNKTWEDYLRQSLTQMLKCDHVVVLPGWEKSAGAQLEVYVARSLSMKVTDENGYSIYENPERAAEETICQEADRLVSSDRQATYGHPYHNFSQTASLWSVILGKEVTPEQVCLCMIGMKISRECNVPKRDNLVDIAGYAKCIELISEYKKK
jgi:hypothetical protein